MSILNVYVKKEGKTTWKMTFPLIYTTLPTKIKYLCKTIFFFCLRLKVLR